jgi:hypothetical protein
MSFLIKREAPTPFETLSKNGRRASLTGNTAHSSGKYFEWHEGDTGPLNFRSNVTKAPHPYHKLVDQVKERKQ